MAAITGTCASLGAALALLAVACAPGEEPPPPAPVDTPDARDVEEEPAPRDLFRAALEVVAGGLEVPWDIAFTPDGDIFVTERPGRVRVIRDGDLVDAPVVDVPAAHAGEGGLHGIALHPDFPDEPYAYVYYTHDNGGLANRVTRFLVEETARGYRFRDEDVVVDAIPAASVHNGGRIDFGPDDMLYIATGDAGRPEASASRDSLAGKILRVTPDGEVPDDNPFGSPVWAYGLRNPQGIAWDEGGNMYASDHGPTGEFGLCCHDELNLIEPGGFYGWPLRAGERDAASPAQAGVAVGDEPIDPVSESGGADTWAPSGIAFVDGPDGGSVVMANLRGMHLRRFLISADDPARVRDERAPVDDLGRLRIARMSPDGCLYLGTSNRDGRGSPADDDDRILRMCP